jgi:thiamine-phosphate pyrophosphorylase
MEGDHSWLHFMAVTDEPGGNNEDFIERISAAVRGGATCVQLRAKSVGSGRMVELTRAVVRRVDVPVIVNDRADAAIAGGAAGVHLGADDLPVERVRSFVPPGFIIGASVGNDEELGGARGADYVGVGPVFGTGSKGDAGPAIGVEEMARLIRASGCPGIGIGGIHARNARSVTNAGAGGVAVLSGIFAAPDIEGAARAIRQALDKNADRRD